jgi:hypothetical protein
MWSSRKPEVRDIRPQADRLQQPNANRNHDDDVQNGFDAGGHGDKSVDQVQRHANYDQHNDKIQQRHLVLLESGRSNRLPNPPAPGGLAPASTMGNCVHGHTTGNSPEKLCDAARFGDQVWSKLLRQHLGAG